MITAVPRMVTALDDEAPEQKAAFCHIAYSLAKLRTPQSRMALSKHLYSEEPWFRVDAAGALAFWPLAEVAQDLMTAIQDPHALTDYASVAIAKQHQPAELLRLQDDLLQEGALEVSIGLLQATAGTFSSDILVESRLHSCLPRIVELADQHGTPRRWRAVLELCDWICKDLDDIAYQDRTVNKDKTLADIRQIRERFSAERVGPLLLDWLRENHLNLADGSQLRHASKLCATFNLADAAPYLIPVAAPQSRAVNEAIDALAQLHALEAAPHLVQLAGQIVDVDERTAKMPNKQAVFEDNPAAAKTYWHILKALACMPTSDTIEYLLKASRDFAADKRQQALASLICVGSAAELKTTYATPVKDRVSEGLADPSPQVRVAALQGVAELQLFSLLPEVVKLTQSRETSVWKQATSTVKRLHADGFSGQVEESIGTAAARERDQYRRDKLRSLLDSLKN
jgi:hypothetical protein